MGKFHVARVHNKTPGRDKHEEGADSIPWQRSPQGAGAFQGNPPINNKNLDKYHLFLDGWTLVHSVGMERVATRSSVAMDRLGQAAERLKFSQTEQPTPTHHPMKIRIRHSEIPQPERMRFSQTQYDSQAKVALRLMSPSLSATVAALAVLWPASGQASLLLNGSFEDLNSNFVDQSSGYMALGQGSTAIAGWTVTNATPDIAWGYGPAAYYPAADGSYFIDLTGFGADSPAGAIGQHVNVTQGVNYTVGVSWATISYGNVGVRVDGVDLSLNTPFGNGLYWTYVEGSFVGGADPNPLLEFYNASPGTASVIIDAASLSLTAVPEPSSVGSLAGVICAAAFCSHRRRPR